MSLHKVPVLPYLILLVMGVMLVVPVSALPGYVVFTFDDALNSVSTNASTILTSHGWNATTYVITDNVGDEGYMNSTQLDDLYAAGWDVASHTKSHTYATLNLSQQVTEICNATEQLDAWGYTRSSHHLAYPGGYGVDANTTIAMNSCNILTGRTVGSEIETIPFRDSYSIDGIRTLGVIEDLGEETAFLQSLESYNVAIYYGHTIGEADITYEMFENLTDVIDSLGIPVVTMSELYTLSEAADPLPEETHDLTLYPVADGHYYRLYANSSYAEILAGAGTGSSSTADQLSVYHLVNNKTDTDKFYALYMGNLQFDTSAIPDDAVIDNVTLVLYKYISDSYNDLGRPTFAITNGTALTNGTISTSNYARRGNTVLVDEVNYTAIVSGNNSFKFNTFGKSYISKTAYTHIYLQLGDYVDGAFSGTWARCETASIYSGFKWRSNESTSDAIKPKLYVDYTIPPLASFTTNTTSGIVPLGVAFTDTSTNTPTDWDWYINDVKFSDLQNPEYLFTEAGVYDISLYAANGASGDWENKSALITVSNWYDLQCQNQTGNISINLFSNSTTSLGWQWDDPVNITKISEDGLYVLTFDNSSDSFIGTGYLPETWHRLKIYNETDFGQLNCTTDAVPVTPTPIPIMPSTDVSVAPVNLLSYWPYVLLALGGIALMFKRF